MNTFKQFVKNIDLVQEAEGEKSGLQKATDWAAQKVLQAKSYKPTSLPGQFTKGFLTGDAETPIGKTIAGAWELVDPLGISSIDDAVEAYTNFSAAPNPITGVLWFVSLFCCTPNLGLFIGGATGAAAGAPAAGVGAVPGAAAGAIIGGGTWVGLKVAAKSALKKLLKNPKKTAKEAEEIAGPLISFVRKTPGGPEAIVTTGEKIAELTGKPLTKEGKETLTKMVGEGTGVKIEGTPKPKEISGSEYMKMSDVEKAEFNKKFAATAEDAVTKRFKFKGDTTESEAFNKVYNQQKWFLGERLAKEGEDINKLSPQEVQKRVIEYIADNPNDPLIEKGLKDIAKEMGSGSSIDTVVTGLKKAYPDFKYYEPKTVSAAVEDIAVKTGAKAASETGVETTAKAAADTSTKAAAEITGKVAKEEIADSVAKQAGLALGRALLKPVKYALVGLGTVGKAGVRAASNVANQVTAAVISSVEKGYQAGGVLGPNKDPERIKRAKQDVGVAPKDNYGEIVYTFNGKILTPAQAAGLGTFATPARYNYTTQRWEEIKTLKPGQEIPIDYADGSKSEDLKPKPQKRTGKFDTTTDFENKLRD